MQQQEVWQGDGLQASHRGRHTDGGDIHSLNAAPCETYLKDEKQLLVSVAAPCHFLMCVRLGPYRVMLNTNVPPRSMSAWLRVYLV